jgi:hypothetical protein
MRPCIPQRLGSPNQGLKAVIFEGRYSKLILAMKKKRSYTEGQKAKLLLRHKAGVT